MSSKVLADWILPQLPENFQSLIEVGCGEGFLLEKIQAQFPGKKMLGFEGSRKACELARSKGLSVERKLVVNDGEELPHADVILLVNIIEHIEGIPNFLAALKNALNEDGRIIFCLPIQNHAGYDIFFAEHIWHFTVDQFCYLLHRNGLEIIHHEYNHPVNHGIGIFVCRKKECFSG